VVGDRTQLAVMAALHGVGYGLYTPFVRTPDATWSSNRMQGWSGCSARRVGCATGPFDSRSAPRTTTIRIRRSSTGATSARSTLLPSIAPRLCASTWSRCRTSPRRDSAGSGL